MKEPDSVRELLVPVLQTTVLITCIASVTVLGNAGVIDAPAITAIIGAIVGSVGVLAGVGIGTRARNGRASSEASEKPNV